MVPSALLRSTTLEMFVRLTLAEWVKGRLYDTGGWVSCMGLYESLFLHGINSMLPNPRSGLSFSDPLASSYSFSAAAALKGQSGFTQVQTMASVSCLSSATFNISRLSSELRSLESAAEKLGVTFYEEEERKKVWHTCTFFSSSVHSMWIACNPPMRRCNRLISP